MAEEPPDQDQAMPFVTAALMMASVRVMMWADRGTLPPVDRPTPDVARFAGPVLEMMRRFTDAEHTEKLRSAVLAGEPLALQALDLVVQDCFDALRVVSDHCVNLLREGRFRQLRGDADDAGELALSLGQRITAVRAFVMSARSSYQLGLLPSTITMYERVIGLATDLTPPLRPELSAAHDNAGVALQAQGMVDRALQHFRQALDWEDDPRIRITIRNQIANSYYDVGEFAAADRLHRQNFAQMQSSYPDDVEFLAIIRDNWARVVGALGDNDRAITLITEAGQALAGGSLRDRYLNRLSRCRANQRAGNDVAAAEDFESAWGMAETMARQTADVEFYRQGLQRLFGQLVPIDGVVWQEFQAGAVSAERRNWQQAVQHFSVAAHGAETEGDLFTHLRAVANVASVMSDSQDRSGSPSDLLNYVRRRGIELGLPQAVAQAALTLSAMLLDGAELNDTGSDALRLTAESLVFAELSSTLVVEFSGPRVDQLTRVDYGVAQARLAFLANSAGALTMAQDYWRRSIDTARKFGNRFGELNRMVGLLLALDRDPAGHAEAHTVAEALRKRLDDPDADGVIDLIVRRTLGSRKNAPDPAQALADLRAAARLLEGLRARQPVDAGPGRPPGSRRSDLDRAYGVYAALHRRMVATGAPLADAFGGVQAMRARDLMETSTARTGQVAPYQPPSVTEAQQLLAACPSPTTLVDITATATGLRAYLLDASGLRAVDVAGDLDSLAGPQWGDARRRAADVLGLVRGSVLLRDLVAAIETSLTPGSAVLLAVDDQLANLPLHVVPVGSGSWSDVRSIGRIPAVGALRFTPKNRGWTGRSLIAGDSDSHLPGAALECREIGKALGVNPLIGARCTLQAVSDDLTGTDFDVVHLAVHGRADVRHGGRGSLLFAGAAGAGPEWVAFDALAAVPWRADLVVFSGCSTAVGGPRNGAGLYGVAQAAAQAGATTVVASLWPVNDWSAAQFMTAFYRELNRQRVNATVIDLRTVMDVARRELRIALGDPLPGSTRTSPVAADLPRAVAGGAARDGRELILDPAELAAEPPPPAAAAFFLDWAPFVLIGDPSLVVG